MRGCQYEGNGKEQQNIVSQPPRHRRGAQLPRSASGLEVYLTRCPREPRADGWRAPSLALFAGKVLSFTLQGQQVVARVEGSFNPYYDVQLRFPAFSQAERANVLACINEQPMLLGAILSGALPDELIAALAKRNVHLLPRQWSEIIGGCNCPDNQGMGGGSFASKPAGAPCKHQARWRGYTVPPSTSCIPRESAEITSP